MTVSVSTLLSQSSIHIAGDPPLGRRRFKGDWTHSAADPVAVAQLARARHCIGW
jgi:hypothetical protein